MSELGDKLEGNIKDAGGKVTGDKKMEWEGKGQKAKGDLEGLGNDLKGDETTTDQPVETDRNV